jgi:hypothetical protein
MLAISDRTPLVDELPRLPQPNGRPVPCFFSRRFLTYRDLVAIGFVNNAMTLRRLITEGRFPPPLALGRQIRLWDALELQDLVDRLAAGRCRRDVRPGASTSEEP